MGETSVEIRCRDDTVPKTVDTRSHCKVWLRACNNLPQPPPYISVFGVAEDCCMLSTIPCSGFLYLQFLARCHPYILFQIFTLVYIMCIYYSQVATCLNEEARQVNPHKILIDSA